MEKLLSDGRLVRYLYLSDKLLNCLLQIFVELGKMYAVNQSVMCKECHRQQHFAGAVLLIFSPGDAGV